MPALATGLVYAGGRAVYNGDTNNSTTTATPIVLTVAGTPVVVKVTSTLAQLTYTYGGTVPTPPAL